MVLRPFAFQSYQSRSAPFINQRLVNLYWENAPDQTAKSPGVLFRRPGLKTFSEVGLGPIRGVHTMRGVPFVVSKNRAFRIEEDGTAVQLGGDEISGLDRIDSADNGKQVAIAAGSAGYIIEDDVVTQITDPNFRAVSSVEYMDAVFIWTVQDSGQIFVSPQFEGLGPYDPLDFATAEFDPDILLKAFRDHDDLFLFGADTIEPWFGSGARDFPFAPNPGAVMETGLLARDSVRKIDNSIIWLGSDERGGRTVWRANGYTPVAISTHALEAKWNEVGNPERAYALTLRTEGHAFYVLTFPDFGTFVYDTITGLWCEWENAGFPDLNLIGFSSAFGKRLTADRRGNRLFEISTTFEDDAGDAIVWEAISPPIRTQNNAYAKHTFFRIDVEAGVTDSDDLPARVYLSWADEDAIRFGPRKLLSSGRQGEGRRRAFMRRLGYARSRVYKISGSDPIPLSIIGMYLDVTPGRW